MNAVMLSVILYYAFLVFVVLTIAFVILRVTRMIVSRNQLAANNKPPSG